MMSQLFYSPALIERFKLRQHLRVLPCRVSFREQVDDLRDILFLLCIHNPNAILRLMMSAAL